METLGDVIMLVLIVAALAVVPYKLFKVWVWPHVRRLGALFVMSPGGRDTARAADTGAIHVSVRGIDTTTDTDAEARDITPIGLHTKPTRREVIITLAMLRGPDNKHLYSANNIAKFVGGAHNDALALIKEVREGTPQPVEYVGERYAQVEQKARLEQLATAGNGHEE